MPTLLLPVLAVVVVVAAVVSVATARSLESDVTSSFLGRRLRKSDSEAVRFPPLEFADGDSSPAAAADSEEDVTITVTPSTFCIRNGTLSVSWSGVINPTANDSIVVYSPPTDRPTELDYLDFIHVSEVIGWKTGAAAVNFTIVNMRTDVSQSRAHLMCMRGLGVCVCFLVVC